MSILYSDEKHTLEDAGFDRLLRRKDIAEQEERQFQQRVEEQRNQHERRERMRIKRLMNDMQNPLAGSLAAEIQEHPEDFPYQPSKRAQQRMRTEANRRFKEVKTEIAMLDILS